MLTHSPTRDLVVGVFVLIGLAAIAFLSLRVGGLALQDGFGLPVFASFDQTGGLKPRAPVVIAGVKVGEVDSISLDRNFRARVDLRLRSSLQLPVDSTASIVTAGLLGDRYVALQVGAESDLLKPGDEIAFTEPALILERLLGKLVHGNALEGANSGRDDATDDRTRP